MAKDKDAFDEKVNTRICNHMNQDHASSVLAMALALDTATKRARMDSVTKTRVTLSVVDGTNPKKRKQLVWPLHPPLKDAGEARVRFVAIHRQVLRPEADEPMGTIVLVVMANIILAGSTTITYFQPLRDLFAFAFPHREGLKEFGGLLFVCHTLEALNALYVAKKVLRLGWGASLTWAAAVLAVGVAALGRLRRLAYARALTAKDD